jgi:hypothetical protein
LLLAGYPCLYWRIVRHGRRRGWSLSEARLYARWCVLAKLPLAVGVLRHAFRRLAGGQVRLIEHKGPDTSRAGLQPPGNPP